jgi:hypothetical protein
MSTIIIHEVDISDESFANKFKTLGKRADGNGKSPGQTWFGDFFIARIAVL